MCSQPPTKADPGFHPGLSLPPNWERGSEKENEKDRKVSAVALDHLNPLAKLSTEELSAKFANSTTSSTSKNLLDLPDHILLHMAGFLPPEDVLQLIKLRKSLLQKYYKERLLSIEKIADDGKKDIALKEFSRKLSKAKFFSLALNLVKKIKDSVCNYRAFFAIIKDMVEEGQLEWALEIARNVPDPKDKDLTLSLIVREASDRGLSDDKRLNLVLGIAREFKDQLSKSEALLEIVKGLVDDKRFDQGLEIAKEIPESSTKDRAFLVIFKPLIKDNSQILEIMKKVNNSQHKKKVSKCLVKTQPLKKEFLKRFLHQECLRLLPVHSIKVRRF